LKRSTVPVDIIVVDNCSKDNTTTKIENDYPEVILIKNQVNEGFGKANNIAIDFALKHDCDYVFLLNQDAWIDSNVIETLSDAFKESPQYGILSPVHLTGNGRNLDIGFSNYTGLKSKEDLAVYASEDSVIKSHIINAAFWMIPVKTLHLIGGFSPLFFHSGEDIDYINRLHYHGYEVGFCPNAYAYHDREYRNRGKEDLVFQMTEYANINHNFYQAFGYGVLAGFKKAFEALGKDGLKEFYRITSITFQLLSKSRKIIQIRKRTKKALKYTFLNLELTAQV
jgi:GT2 family glycosyltransferase